MKLKSVWILTLLFCASTIASAQSSKQVKWTTSVVKKAPNTFEVHWKATIGAKFHLYAQNAGIEGPLPTTFTFTKNPLVQLDGKVKEVGKLIRKREEVWGGDVNFYEQSVEFVQLVKLKAPINTTLAAKVEFMVCNESECLAPSDVTFSVAISGK